MKYDPDEKLKTSAVILYGLQWFVVTIPAIITMGLILGKIHFGSDPQAQSFYMQKLFFISGITLLIQVLYGHKLPLVIGPASVLLIGILSSLPASFSAIYTAIMIGGIFITLISIFGLLKYFQKIFTSRVVIVIMLLIPLTLGPTIIKLIFNNEIPTTSSLIFMITISILLLLANKLLKGVWKSTTLIIGIIVSTIIYHFFFAEISVSAIPSTPVEKAAGAILITPDFDFGVIIAFLFCAIALMINEVGSIEAVGQILSAKNMEKRNKSGVLVTGISNVFAGFIGTIGTIDYSLSLGVISSSGCASRYPFIPAAVLLIICSFLSPLVNILLTIPDIVMGTILLYVMVSQFAAGFQFMVGNKAVMDFNDGASIGLSLMIALLISFMPKEFSEQIPSLLRPVLSNGFVMGVGVILIMEHLIFRKKPESSEK